MAKNSADLPSPPGFRGRWLTQFEVRCAYSEGAGPYRLVPAAVAIPADRDDVVGVVRWVAQEGLALIPRGAGSGMPGGNVGRGVILDLQRLRQPFSISTRGTAAAGAAVTWRALSDAAAPEGLRLPPDPSSGEFCTIGGMIATNAAGARSVRYGPMRQWVRGLELVTADGECAWLARGAPDSPVTCGPPAGQPHPSTPRFHQRFERDAAEHIGRAEAAVRERFPAIRKNTCGYALDSYLASGDLLDLVIGSEGTLGVITRAELQLDPLPGGVAGLLLGLDGLESLGEVVTRLNGFAPAAVELLDRTYLALAGEREPVSQGGAAAVLLVDFEAEDGEAARAVVEGAVEQTADLCTFAEPALTPTERERLWKLRHAASPVLATLPDTRRSLQVIEDGCVPVHQLGAYLLGVREAAARLGIEIVAFGHAGDGHLHINALVDVTDPDFEGRLEELLLRVSDLLVELRGSPSGEHGDGRLRAGLVERIYGPEVVELFAAVKQAFDPDGIMNPGVILPEPNAAPLDHLKVGPRARDIPDEIAEGLRELERTGGWGLSKTELLSGLQPR
jgi:FAD/FMN-containing dehydrogenase